MEKETDKPIEVKVFMTIDQAEKVSTYQRLFQELYKRYQGRNAFFLKRLETIDAEIEELQNQLTKIKQ